MAPFTGNTSIFHAMASDCVSQATLKFGVVTKRPMI